MRVFESVYKLVQDYLYNNIPSVIPHVRYIRLGSGVCMQALRYLVKVDSLFLKIHPVQVRQIKVVMKMG